MSSIQFEPQDSQTRCLEHPIVVSREQWAFVPNFFGRNVSTSGGKQRAERTSTSLIRPSPLIPAMEYRQTEGCPSCLQLRTAAYARGGAGRIQRKPSINHALVRWARVWPPRSTKNSSKASSLSVEPAADSIGFGHKCFLLDELALIDIANLEELGTGLLPGLRNGFTRPWHPLTQADE